jgi:AcrR family transcriptional regulator
VEAKRVRLPAEERRREIVEAAFALLAAEGFEGFRTRDVADRARINSATLHHYFPTKEDLVAAVAAHLEDRFRSEKAPKRAVKGVAPALAALRAEFADMSFYRRHRPEMLVAYRELAIRAERDETTRALVVRLNDEWRASIARILKAGVDDGVFRDDLHAASAATLIAGALWGTVSLFGLSEARFDKTCDELERWLVATSPEGASDR